ncbi:MAG: T9SS type A sorting domain-containing protein [Bacteroidetes bacterium]|nr:T9SS type A sorting domain-containing protein [Bacteroidota bacterium]
MKKQLLLLATILYCTLQHLFAQTYYPFKTDSATWTVVEYGAGTFPYPPQTGTWHFGLSGDTVFNSLTYSKIYANLGSLGSINPEGNFNRQTANYYGAFREDATKKVWFRKPSLSTDILYYDFALNLGDTFCFNYQPCGVLCHPVSLIDSILINGNYRKRIHFDYNGQSEIWIQGIGSAFDNWIGDWCFTGNISWTLNCYKEKNIPIYGSCNYPTGLIESEAQDPVLVFSPNPVNNSFTIQTSVLDDYNITICNLTGHQIRNIKFVGNSYKGSVYDLKAGVYILTIVGKTNSISKTIKVIKQDE